MKTRHFSSDREKVFAVVLLLAAVIASFLLRVPCAPLLTYGNSAHVDAHARSQIPAFAILTDVVYLAVLIILPVSFFVTSIAQSGWVTVAVGGHRLTPALRC